MFTWGNDPKPDEQWMANCFKEGLNEELAQDGYKALLVGSFPPNGYGLYGMVGNV